MHLRIHILSIGAIVTSCAVSGFVLADGLQSQWKTRLPISTLETGATNDMTQFSAYDAQKKVDVLNSSDLAKLLVDERSRLTVRKGKQRIQEETLTILEQKLKELSDQGKNLRSVKKNIRPQNCSTLHTHERAECLSQAQYNATVQYRTAFTTTR